MEYMLQMLGICRPFSPTSVGAGSSRNGTLRTLKENVGKVHHCQFKTFISVGDGGFDTSHARPLAAQCAQVCVCEPPGEVMIVVPTCPLSSGVVPSKRLSFHAGADGHKC